MAVVRVAGHGPSRERVADMCEVAVATYYLLVARNASHPLAHSDVRGVREIQRRKTHQGGAIHTRSRDTELTDEGVGLLQMLEELKLGAPHVDALK